MFGREFIATLSFAKIPLAIGVIASSAFVGLPVLTQTALAQTKPAAKPAENPASKPGAARSALLFDKLCYEMVPNFASLEKRAASLKWQPITGPKLQGFKPAAPAKVLKAWVLADFGVKYQIAISHSDMDDQSKKSFPGFANAQVYSCSLVLPAKEPRAKISAAMQKLMGRKPDEAFDQGRLVFNSWNGQDKTRRVIINHMGAKAGGPGGLISVTLMIKK